MYESFDTLNQDRKILIINAALKEFAEHGYTNASTNKIVKNAKVSKGILFYHFKTKKELFMYLHHFAHETFIEEYLNHIDVSERDTLLRLKGVFRVQFELLYKYPHMIEFIRYISKVFPDDFEQEFLKQHQKESERLLGVIFSNIDRTLFKPTVDVDLAIEILTWTLSKYTDELIYKIKKENQKISMRAMNKKVNDMIALFKQSFYK